MSIIITSTGYWGFSINGRVTLGTLKCPDRSIWCSSANDSDIGRNIKCWASRCCMKISCEFGAQWWDMLLYRKCINNLMGELKNFLSLLFSDSTKTIFNNWKQISCLKIMKDWILQIVAENQISAQNPVMCINKWCFCCCYCCFVFVFLLFFSS